MKVGFNARTLTSSTLRGWSRYSISLLKELANLGIELVLYSDQPLDRDHLSQLPPKSYTVRVAPAMRYFRWEQVWLPQQFLRDKIDLFHCLFNFGLPSVSPCPRVLTLHDAIDQIYYAPQQSWQQRLSLAALQTGFYHRTARTHAERVITVSHHAKMDLDRSLKIPSAKISVIYEAADDRFHQTIAPRKSQEVIDRYQLRSPYVFYVGGLEQRKNLPFLIRAFAEANLIGVELILAGGQAEEQNRLRGLAESLNIANQIRFLGWVEDDDLPALYQGALCFVYASEYEGFGLQLCEAMAAGCPTLAAQATCLPEILGDGGIPFSLKDTQELSNCLRYLKADPAYRSQLGQRAKRRSQQFSWQQTAAETLRVYQSVLSPQGEQLQSERNLRLNRQTKKFKV
jgi:glycosyltransferase involved in cell wall biosynthesis